MDNTKKENIEIVILAGKNPVKDTAIIEKKLKEAGVVTVISESKIPGKPYIDMDEQLSLKGKDLQIGDIITGLHLNFNELPLLVEGESKIIRLLGNSIVLEMFKPTVYSFSKNRYGIVEGTEEIRARFTAEIFKHMNLFNNKEGNYKLNNAFLGMINSPEGTIIAQKRLEPGNLEVRVKRFHVGSPVHRYRYTWKYPTVTENGKPLQKWDRFKSPVVCFDWRNPLTDDDGNRLADEPISDDYAAIWIEDVPSAKQLASETFLWLEQLFGNAGLTLIDICFFIDQSGKYIFGEISPDCMRVREGTKSPGDLQSLDKDLWREGEKEENLKKSYERLYNLIFNN